MALASSIPVMAGPFEVADFEKLVPADKKLHPEWVKSLFARGERTVYRGADLAKIGMPVGGLCTGQLYLGGDGKLWHWDIFNRIVGTGDGHYAHPPQPASPLDQGFALRLTTGGKRQLRALDGSGWRDVSFNGEYPIANVEYRDPESPVSVSLEAFSPFIPLNTEDSALPATVMRFTVKNNSADSVEAEVEGWLENAVCLYTAQSSAGVRRNRIVRRSGFTFLEASAEPAAEKARQEKRPDIVFEDFEKETYEGWTVTGTAFGTGPIEKDRMPAYQGDVGAHGRRLVNSHNTRQGEDVAKGDAHTGTLTSRPFVIERDFITFLIGGGAHEGRTCVNLLLEGKVVRSATGKNDNRMAPATFDVRQLAGRTAQLEIVDKERGSWGNIGIDDIVFTDEPAGARLILSEQPDFGTMGLAVLEEKNASSRMADVASPSSSGSSQAVDDGVLSPGTLATTALPKGHSLNDLFARLDARSVAPATQPFGQKLTGAIGRKLSLAPGQTASVTFVVTWHFPNLKLAGLGNHRGRWYGRKFPDARAVAEYVASNFARLHQETRLWHDTWYDSTLPYWFLDRTFLNTSILATSTCYWLGNGRFYAWEGVGCCAGTCDHVWHYAHAMARLFPALERSVREMVDYGVGFDPETGRIRFRAEHNNHWAVDGQSGCILRTYREHQMSGDSAFLLRLWPRVKKSLEFLMGKDVNGDGIIDGPQHNTLDADWYGEVAWLSGLYLAALRAGEEMAKESGDDSFARRCREIFERGRRNIDERLFNGEYYIQLADPNHRRDVGSYDGCEIDQVFGQSWAWQVGLGAINDEAKRKTALHSLWKYNFTPDVGPYRSVYRPGRWYALAGEGGLLMCSWPRGDAARVKQNFDYYFNECMTGFEYQVAWHSLAEGMPLEGLAITRTIHDRYHARRRNPWNEVECGDHYARAMASYGVFLAACGFEYHGPKRHLGFAPRLQPDNFRAAFTSAEGWGTFTHKVEATRQEALIELKWGKLRLKSLALGLGVNGQPNRATVRIADQQVGARLVLADDKKVLLTFEQEVELNARGMLRVVLE